jgi:GWxTD domain-containing protein
MRLKLMMSVPRAVLVSLMLVGLILPFWTQAQDLDAGHAALQREEEARDYFHKWLTQDVVYIITPEERDVFLSLTTIEEKENFIESFWHRRDPDPRTGINEFKEEHYRRIAYANERFTSGVQGWMMDRGRIYIIHGPPDEIQSHSAGQTYNRPMSEGGGTTAVFPFEIWRYRNLPGIGSDVELEFVDKSFSGYYQLVFSPWEKDLLLRVDGAGQTLAEELGFATREQHPFFSPALRDREAYPFYFPRAKDDPFERYELFAQVQRPPEIKFQDLREMVQVDVTFDNLKFNVRESYFRLNDEQVLVPITIELENRDLKFEEEFGTYTSRLAVYGIVTSITNQITTEFEDEVSASYGASEIEQGRQGQLMYQKAITLPRGVRHRLDLVVKDLKNGNVGVVRRGLAPPRFPDDHLAASPIILSNYIRKLFDVPLGEQMFVLGDLWIRPSVTNAFSSGDRFGAYLQVYNAAVEQTTFQPELEVHYRVYRDKEPLLQLSDRQGESVYFHSGQRVVLLKVLELDALSPGDYRLEVVIRDRLTDSTVRVAEKFTLVESRQLALAGAAEK